MTSPISSPPPHYAMQDPYLSALIAEIGAPPVLVLGDEPGRPTVLSFHDAEDGDGVVLLRSARSGDGLLPQWRAVREMLVRRKLVPRTIVAGSRLSGVAPLTRRLDLAFVRASIAGEWCRWVACVDTSRLSRDGLLAGALLEELDDHGCDLYLAGPDLKLRGLPKFDHSLIQKHQDLARRVRAGWARHDLPRSLYARPGHVVAPKAAEAGR